MHVIIVNSLLTTGRLYYLKARMLLCRFPCLGSCAAGSVQGDRKRTDGRMNFSHSLQCLSPQISDIQVNGQSDDMTAKEKLLLWSQRMVEGYQGLRCDNFTSSWRDGKLFSAIIHKHR